MEICNDYGYNDIGVVIATKWRHYLFYLQLYAQTWEVLTLKNPIEPPQPPLSNGSQTWLVDFFRFQACMTLKKLRVENLADSKCKFIVTSY